VIRIVNQVQYSLYFHQGHADVNNIFVNIISRPYSRSANQVHRRSFSFCFFFIYIHNMDPYSNSESRSLRPKFRFQIHVCFTVSFLSLVIFTGWTYSYNNIISPACRQHSHRISIYFPARRQHSIVITCLAHWQCSHNNNISPTCR
jgi:hypothetical protein